MLTVIEADIKHPSTGCALLLATSGAPASLLTPQDYLHQWTTDLDKAGRTISRNDLQDGTLWHWLIDRGYAQPHDRPGLERLLETRVDNFDMRPSITVSRRWPWHTARELDGDGRHSRLVDEVRDAVDHLLAILDEPQLADLG